MRRDYRRPSYAPLLGKGMSMISIKKTITVVVACAVLAAPGLSLSGSEEMLFALGQQRFKAKRYNEAIACFSSVIDAEKISDKNKAAAYGWRGIVRSAKGEYEDAVVDFDKAIELNRNDPSLWFNRSTAFVAQGLFDKAHKSVTKAISLDQKNYSYYYSRGTIRTKLNDLEKARDDFTAAISIDNTRAGAYYERARIESILEEYDKAKTDIEKATALSPDNWEYDALKKEILEKQESAKSKKEK